ncbi:phosphoribosyltransferase [Phaeovulum sp.]|uniref:phosphoribosyltransferase n=1 Tax=Phaeovulum sp. TaxID=2934796 RepID=UPI0039E642DC
MQFRSIADMNDTIVKAMRRLPHDLDLVVGVPRSGMIAAQFVALLGNIRLTDLDSYLAGRIYSSGKTKATGMRPETEGRRRVLVIDDSINGGTAMKEAKARVAAAGLKDDVIFAAVYGSKPHHPEADLVFETVPWPRLFQWNFMHHKFLKDSCIDIDGVLCHDPTAAENDDGAAYLHFLATARPLYRMTRPLGTLVTSRLERYRPQTESWLAAQGVRYDRLVMLDLPSKAARQRLAAHGSFKGEYYRDSDAILFIESENRQALRIAEIAGKPVLCLQTNRMITPSNAAATNRLLRNEARPARRLLKKAAYALLGAERVALLKQRLRG